MKYEVLRGINHKEKRFEPGEVLTTRDLPKPVIKSLLKKEALVEIEEGGRDGETWSEGEDLP